MGKVIEFENHSFAPAFDKSNDSQWKKFLKIQKSNATPEKLAKIVMAFGDKGFSSNQKGVKALFDKFVPYTFGQ